MPRFVREHQECRHRRIHAGYRGQELLELVVHENGPSGLWLYEVLSPRAQQVVVAAVSESRELDALEALRGQAKKAMLAEAKRHPEYGLVKSCPGLGPVRTAELLPIVVTPYRFQSKRASGRTVDWGS